MKSLTSILLLFLLISFLPGKAQTHLFNFGQRYDKDAVLIDKTNFYSNDLSYGFDLNNKEEVEIIQHKKAFRKSVGFCTAEVPFYFSVKLPEGTYRVDLTFGHPKKPSQTSVKAEARRLMLFNHELKAGDVCTKSFLVNVRSPQIDKERSIKLKARELNYMNWDKRLSLEFSGENVAIRSIAITPAQNYTTIFLAGNSTVTDQDCAPWASWGQMITPYFDEKVAIANYAESGESLASFKGAGRLDKVLSLMKPGDYLFIEFGHNDQKRKGEGIGPWLSFTDLLTEFVTRAREAGGIPVLLTPTQRRSFNSEGQIELTHGEYPAAMRKVAAELNVPLIDLNAQTKRLYEAWGPEASKKAFVHYAANTFPSQEKELADNTHFNTFGAHEIAQLVLQGVIDLDLEISRHITNFKAPYQPENPSSFSDWNLVMSPRFVSIKPEGN
ncbi:rhamnogalacturonan acetylesterase [Roseimarinus sediminis]|uniref:rhamnogalacturonan acetylesterase n=1 Tax=Roseimarinus sediminis TaxID=1610899 RepID=UPI003D1ADF32